MGTCAMIPEELNSVVDSRLKVYGTKNLRVLDASIFPMEALGLALYSSMVT
jgi:choline dehydrogenase-like flavoprotein